MVIGVDFDGTIVEDKYPEIGKEIPFATETLKMLIKNHHRLILWTVREGKYLEDAVNWMAALLTKYAHATNVETSIYNPKQQ